MARPGMAGGMKDLSAAADKSPMRARLIRMTGLLDPAYASLCYACGRQLATHGAAYASAGPGRPPRYAYVGSELVVGLMWRRRSQPATGLPWAGPTPRGTDLAHGRLSRPGRKTIPKIKFTKAIWVECPGCDSGQTVAPPDRLDDDIEGAIVG